MFSIIINNDDLATLKKLVNSKNINQFIRTYARSNLLLAAIAENKNDIIEFLLKNGIDINHIDKEKKNALEYSVIYENYNLAKYLLEHGINKNQKDVYGNNPIWRAAFKSRKMGANYDFVKLLKKFDCDYTSVNNVGKSPLDIAIQSDDQELKDILEGKPL